MPLEEIELSLTDLSLPEGGAEWIAEANRRIDALFESGENNKYPTYLPSDPVQAFAALNEITQKELPLGRNFCEWGSGYGIVTGLASMAGYEAYGIEQEIDLVESAEQLAADMKVDATFCCTNYLPEGFDSYVGMGAEYLMEAEEMQSRDPEMISELAYEGMDIEIADIDVFFVFPSPQQQDFVQELFDAIAVEGAILICYHKMGRSYAFRKIGEEDW